MEINLKNLSDQALQSTTEGTKMRLSEDASSMVFQLFTKNVYSNPIGTVVREITSNCFDSHTEAGVNAPVLIKKHMDVQTGTNYISFIDYGVGMSPDRVQNIYGVYFESTKRVDNTQIGGFGIGGKTPLAYKRSTGQGEGEYDNSFYVVTIFDNVKYFYCISEGAESPVIHKLHEEPTTEHNGTEIQIPVLEKDVETFAKEMVRQLYYFENIVFQGFEETYQESTLTNEYQIIRGKNFLFRGSEYNSSAHVCLGRVAYPIDYNVLGLNSSDYSLPIALRLEVGDIGVTVSRESLDYSEKTIKVLKAKLEAAKSEIITLIEKQYSDIRTLEQYFAVKTDFGQLEFSNGMSLYVGNLINQKDVDFSNFKYQFTKMPTDKQLFRFFFETKQMGKKERRSRWSSNNTNDIDYDTLKKSNNIYYFKNEWKRKIIKQSWLKQKHETYYIVSQNDISGSWVKKQIADLFNVSLEETETKAGNPVPFIKTLLGMQKEFMGIVQKYGYDYDTLDVPEDFIAQRKLKSAITPEMRKISIPVKFVGGYSKDRVKLSVLFDYNMPIFYGTAEDEYVLKNAMKMFNLLFDEDMIVSHASYDNVLVTGRGYRSSDKDKTKGSIAFIQLAQNNIKYMEHCKNAYHVSEFNWRMLYRKENMVQEYFQTYELIEKFDMLNGFYRNGFIDVLNQKLGDKVKKIQSFIDNLSNNSKNDDIRFHKSTLSSYFKLDNLKQTPEQKKILKEIQELLEIQKKNEKTLNYFRIPCDVEELDEELKMILELSLSL